jgi:hypothetical protein
VEQKVKIRTNIIQITMKNLLGHTDPPCELLPSLLIRESHMGKISILGWLTGLVKLAIWANSFYFIYLLLLSVSKILASSHLAFFLGMLG